MPNTERIRDIFGIVRSIVAIPKGLPFPCGEKV